MLQNNILILISFLASFNLTKAQVSYVEIESARLNTKRQLKIKLPKDYDEYSEIKYPVIVVFDGDYLFEPIAGQVSFQSYFDDMPKSIIVGVMQSEEREYDGYCDEVSGLPKESGLRFHEFIAEELLPYIDYNFNTSNFKVAVGHDLMGNFINSYLFKEEPAFQAYVAISPDLFGSVKDYLAERLKFFESDIFYYMATSDKDIPVIRKSVLSTHEQIKAINNQYLTYYFDDFKDESHYTLVTSAIAISFDKIFELYKPIREKELEEKVLPYEGTFDKYLVERYNRIEELFGIKKPIEPQEYEKVVKIAEERNDNESIEKIGKLARKLNPNSVVGHHYLALHAEKTEEIKKAIKFYKEAQLLEETPLITQDFISDKLEQFNGIIETQELEAEEKKAAEKLKKEEEKIKRKSEVKAKKEKKKEEN